MSDLRNLIEGLAAIERANPEASLEHVDGFLTVGPVDAVGGSELHTKLATLGWRPEPFFRSGNWMFHIDTSTTE